jgi:hypothetical protein
MLCVCAEYFLPEGVHNAMDLLHKEQWAYQQQQEDEAQQSLLSDTASEEQSVALLPQSPNISSQGRSASFRDGMDTTALPPNPLEPQAAPSLNAPTAEGGPGGFVIPRTPPPVSTAEPRFRTLSPPPPPGSRFMARGILRTARDSSFHATTASSRGGTPRLVMRPPHPLSVLHTPMDAYHKGRYVPHVVTVSLDTSPLQQESISSAPRSAVARGHRPRLGQLLEACPLDATKASAVTCVKFSPSADFCLIGYGVREPLIGGSGGGSTGNLHPVTAVYRVRGGMEQVSTMLSGDDDVNIARFHPDSGHSFVYGTKQGRVRVLSPRPWNF